MTLQLLYALDAKCLSLARISLYSFCLHAPVATIRVVTPAGVDITPLHSIADAFQRPLVHSVLADDDPIQRLPSSLRPYFYCLSALAQPGSGPSLLVDADTLCVGDLQRLHALRLTAEHPIAACSHHRPMPDRQLALHLPTPFHYFNAGVLLFDPQHLAQHFRLDAALQFFDQHQVFCRFREQCVLNALLSNHLHFLPPRFNLLSWMRHRARRSPWQSELVNPMASLLPQERANAQIVHYSNGCLPRRLHWYQRDCFDRYWLQLEAVLHRWERGGGRGVLQAPLFTPTRQR